MALNRKTLLNAFTLLLLGFALGYAAAYYLRCGSGPSQHSMRKDREAYFLELYTDRLDLSNDQQIAVRAIIESRRDEFSSLFKDMRPKFKELREKYDGQIEELLAENQLAKFDALKKELANYRKERWGKGKKR